MYINMLRICLAMLNFTKSKHIVFDLALVLVILDVLVLLLVQVLKSCFALGGICSVQYLYLLLHLSLYF